jgi:hypothetical protein
MFPYVWRSHPFSIHTGDGDIGSSSLLGGCCDR